MDPVYTIGMWREDYPNPVYVPCHLEDVVEFIEGAIQNDVILFFVED